MTVLLADPPWPHANGSRTNSGKSPKYPLMSFEAINALAPAAQETTGEHGVLYLWSTSPHLPRAIETMVAWGFTYRSWHVWRKQKIACGFWVRSNAELVLIGERGRPAKPLVLHPSVIEGSGWSAIHSAKPDRLHAIIEQAWPRSRKVEWFARQQRDGWECLGSDLGAMIAA
jgi:N6-adenosine-specific RNA methylase IME4